MNAVPAGAETKMRPALSHRQNGGGSLTLAAATKRTAVPTPYQLRTKAVSKA